MMHRNTMVGLITGSVIGAAVGMVAVSNMSPRDMKKAMRSTRKMLMKATGLMGMDMF